MIRAEPDVGADHLPWINPVGGLGDMLMLSGVLKVVADRHPERRFHVVRRTGYQALLRGHPAVAGFGYPPPDARIQHVTYWSLEPLGPGRQRPFQILARAFGLETPVEERLFLPGDLGSDPLLEDRLPWRSRNVLIAPASDSPRKMCAPGLWQALVERLRGDGALVVQAGRMGDAHVRGAWSLLGLTTPHQLVALLPRFDAVVTPDNFVMHAAHLAGVPAVVLWGPTSPEVYGWPGQTHLPGVRACGETAEEGCLAPRHNVGGRLYGTTCPHLGSHCVEGIRPDQIHEAVHRSFRSGRQAGEREGRS
jgi:ADP-heptose:LPS heptosyltransferase